MEDQRREIARYNQRIMIQKNTTEIDAIRNRKCVWKDYYQCWAYASTYQYDEENNSSTTRQEETINFEVRWSDEVKDINSVNYRIVFDGKVYNIISVDNMNHQHKKVRFRSKLEK